MSTISYDQEFVSDVRGVISDWLYDRIGNTVFISDLQYNIVQGYHMNGYWIFGTEEALNYICKHYWIAKDLIDYYQEECDIVLNPFESPESFTVWLLDYGVGELLNENKYVQDHWDEEIELTKEIAQSILDNI